MAILTTAIRQIQIGIAHAGNRSPLQSDDQPGCGLVLVSADADVQIAVFQDVDGLNTQATAPACHVSCCKIQLSAHSDISGKRAILTAVFQLQSTIHHHGFRIQRIVGSGQCNGGIGSHRQFSGVYALPQSHGGITAERHLITRNKGNGCPLMSERSAACGRGPGQIAPGIVKMPRGICCRNSTVIIQRPRPA